MGKLIDSAYKTIYLTPEEDKGTMQVFMLGKALGPETYKTFSDKPKVENISIVAGNLDQKEFDVLIHTIARGSKKPTWVSFMPNKNEEEEVAAAYKRYADNYVSANPKNMREFPSNVFINNVYIEYESDKPKKRTI